MAVSKLGVNLCGVVGRAAVLAAVREWVAGQPADAPLRGLRMDAGLFEERSPRREARRDHRDRPMYLFSADAHDMVQHRGDARGRDRAGHPDLTRGPVLGARPRRDPTGHAVEAAAYMPIIITQGLFSVANIRTAQELTLQAAPSWGVTAYFEAGAAAGSVSADALDLRGPDSPGPRGCPAGSEWRAPTGLARPTTIPRPSSRR